MGSNIATASCVVMPGTPRSYGVVCGLSRSPSPPLGENAARRWPWHATVSPAGKPLLVLARMPPTPSGAISGSGEVAGFSSAACETPLACSQISAKNPCSWLS